MITKTCLNCYNTHVCCVKCGTWHSMSGNDCEHVWGIMFDCSLREDNPNVVNAQLRRCLSCYGDDEYRRNYEPETEATQEIETIGQWKEFFESCCREIKKTKTFGGRTQTETTYQIDEDQLNFFLEKILDD